MLGKRCWGRGDGDLNKWDWGKYAINVITIKSYQKSFVFLVTLTLTIPQTKTVKLKKNLIILQTNRQSDSSPIKFRNV